MKNILLLENDNFFVKSIDMYLSKVGYKVTVVDNGHDATLLLNNGGFDVVLASSSLINNGSGDFVNFLNTKFKSLNTKLVLVTPTNNVNMLNQFNAISADAIVSKPINFLSLTTALKNLTELKNSKLAV